MPIILFLSIALIGGLAYCSQQEDSKWNDHLLSEMAKCRSNGESEYTCKAYTASLDAKRSADEAENAAAISIIMSSSSKR